MRQALHRIVASAVVVGCGAVCAPQTTEAQPVRRGLSAPVTQTVAMLPGRLDGLVTDDHGVPLAGAAISAQGAGLQFAVTDERGGLPLLAPMSEVAGRLAIEAAAFALRMPGCPRPVT